MYLLGGGGGGLSKQVCLGNRKREFALHLDK